MKIILRFLYLMFVGFVLVSCAGAPQTWVDFESSIPFRDTVQLRGILSKPKGEGPFPAVVMLCGCGGLKQDAEHQAAWAKRLTSWGYVTLQVDSFGPRGFEDGVCYRPDAVGERIRSYDAYWAKSFLAKQGYVDPKRMAVIGWSHGGWTVLRLADAGRREDAFPPFQAAVAIYPWCTLMNELGTPLLILAGAEDEDCPAERCVVFQNSSGVRDSRFGFVIKVYPDAYHCFDFEGMKEEVGGKHYEYNRAATEDAIVQVRNFLANYLETE